MKIEDRKPRPSRFGTESQEARLAVLRDRAPTLESSRKLRVYAIFGSVLLFLTLAAFYFAMQIYRVATEQREEDALIEVEKAGDIPQSEAQKALERVESDAEQSEVDYQRQLEELKSVDLLEETSPGEGG